MYYVIFGLLFFAGFAMMIREGFWSNTLNVIAIMLSGLAAFGLYQPLTIMLDEKTDGSYTYLLDIVVLYGVFVISVILLKALFGVISRNKLRFRRPIDDIGGPAMAAIGGYAAAAFVMASLHAAPLWSDIFGLNYGATLGAVKSEVESRSSITSPDLAALRMAEKMLGPDVMGDGKFKTYEYIFIHGDHRAKFEKNEGNTFRRS
jgi:hypothetical protein